MEYTTYCSSRDLKQGCTVSEITLSDLEFFDLFSIWPFVL
jgi:hypothetical protein